MLGVPTKNSQSLFCQITRIIWGNNKVDVAATKLCVIGATIAKQGVKRRPRRHLTALAPILSCRKCGERERDGRLASHRLRKYWCWLEFCLRGTKICTSTELIYRQMAHNFKPHRSDAYLPTWSKLSMVQVNTNKKFRNRTRSMHQQRET